MGNYLPSKEYSSDSEDEDKLEDEFNTDSDLDNCEISHLVMDANVNSKIIPYPALNAKQMNYLESHLDIYEKVSLLFLLYNDPSLGLQEIKKIINENANYKCLQVLMENQASLELIEALSIIQNYQVLKELGFHKEDLQIRFVPNRPFISLYVNKHRKALYSICESFNRADTEKFLDFARSDFKNKHLEFKNFDHNYLELYFLHWEDLGFIKPNNFNNLYAILKQMELFVLCDNLKQIIPEIQSHGNKQNKTIDASSNNSTKKPSKVYEDILNSNVGLEDLDKTLNVSIDDNNSLSDEVGDIDDKYSIDYNNPGVCLIINQVYFYRDPEPKYQDLLPPSSIKLETRHGTDKDKDDLVKIFKEFGFKVILENNLTHIEIVKTLEDVIQSVRRESSLFICIMSHGDEGVVYGVNSCGVSVNTIQNLMCKKNRANLLGKPKILILQSCQGTKCQKIPSLEDSEDFDFDGATGNYVIPDTADMLTFWATVPGFSAIRHKKSGSWFIQSFCENMRNLAYKFHFEDICTTIVRDVAGKHWLEKDAVMVPYKFSTLRKHFYLPPIKSF